MDREYIKRLLPEFKDSLVKRINEGNENWVFEIDKEIIVKIPKNEKNRIKIQNEIKFINVANANATLKKLLPHVY